MNNNVCVLIPAYKPDNNLVELIHHLLRLGMKNIVVVRDGGGPECDNVFSQLPDNIHLVNHEHNLGKGRALKSGLNYITRNFPINTGVVTADADGQHLPSDIVAIAEELKNNPRHLILGARAFNKNVPFRSKFGNTITKYVFSFLSGKEVTDTQTGLRGIPARYIPILLKTSGEGYEYEMNVLIDTKKYNIPIKEYAIQTVYIEDNKNSHFNPFLDSLKIYFLLFCFAISSVISFGIEYGVYILMLFFFKKGLAIAVLVSRVVSMLINFSVNRKVVFKSNIKFWEAFLKYSMLTFISGLISYSLIKVLHEYVNMNVILAKVISDIGLFFVNFFVQNKLIFRHKKA